MTSLFRIGIQVGATLAGAFTTTFSSVRSTLAGLSTTTDYLSQRHQRLGNLMAQSLAHPLRNLQHLREQYDKLGNTLQTLERRHNQLTASLARGEGLRQDRQRMSGEIMSTVATAAAVGMPVAGAIKQAANFELGVRDIAITGNLSNAEEVTVSQLIRKAALQQNQSHEAIITGVNTMVQQGMDATKAGEMANLLGQAATATNAEMVDLAKMMFSLEDRLQIKGTSAMREALNRAAFGAKLGRFELKDMAAYLPEFSAAFASRGMTGQEALTQIVASLEVGHTATGTPGEAATNLRAWAAHMTSSHTVDEYRKAGVDYQASMRAHLMAGMTQYEGSIAIADAFITSKGDAFMKKWKGAQAKKDEGAMRALMESFGLGEIFRDIQTINHLIAMRGNKGLYNSFKAQMGGKLALQTIDSDSGRRMNTTSKGWDRMKTQVADLGITIGGILLPHLNSALSAITPLVNRFAAFSTAHPGLIKGIIGFALGVTGLKLAVLAAGWGLNFFLLSPINAVRTGIITLMSRWTMLRAIFMMGSGRLPFVLQLMGLSKLGPMILRVGGWFRAFGGILMTVGRFMLPFGQGLLMGVLGPFKLLGQGVLWLGSLMVGKLAVGLRLAGQALLWLGRAAMMNPIGLLITAIAIGAYLIYRNWDKLKPWFLGLWASVKAITSRAWEGLKHIFFNYTPGGLLIKHWQPITAWFGNLWNRVKAITSSAWASLKAIFFKFTPLGILIANFTPIMTWFKGLPARFAGFGRDIINGLITGLKDLANKPLETITAMGSAIRDQFKSVLGIRSPSRVFTSLGQAVADGATAGINKGRGATVGAVASMALATTAAWGKPQLSLLHNLPDKASPAWVGKLDPLQKAVDQRDATAQGPGMTIHFSPNITISSSDPAVVKEQVGQAMQLSFEEFSRMMERYQRDGARRSYKGS